MQKNSQALLTFVVGGRLALKGANAGTKKEVRKFKKVKGNRDPKIYKWSELYKLLNIEGFKKNNQQSSHRNYTKYVEPTYYQVVRKLRWTPEQVNGMLSVPVGMSEKQWNKLKDEEKLKIHANRCLLPGETSVIVDLFV